MSTSGSEGGDRLKVPSQRSDEAPRDEEWRSTDEAQQTDTTGKADHVADDGRDPAPNDSAPDRDQTLDDTYDDTYDDRDVAVTDADADRDPALSGAPGEVRDDRGREHSPADESPYKDPYREPYTEGDMLAEPEPAAVSATQPDPAHAAPRVFLFEQDAVEVQARWRDLQAAFVDDPGEAVQRADALVGEVVEALTSALANRTHALRERWKDAGSPDTEELRLALRDYRNVLERLLALTSESGYESRPQTQETR